jgi:epsilon-lactone hydrolase
LIADYPGTMNAATLEPELTPVVLPARAIEPPATISNEARAAPALAAKTPATAYPSPEDQEGWRQAMAASEALWDPVATQILAECRCHIETQSLAGVTAYLCTPNAPGAGSGPVYLYIRGGAFVFGAGKFAKAFGAKAADELALTTARVGSHAARRIWIRRGAGE